MITIYVNSLFTLEKFKLLVKEKLCAGKIAEKNSCRHEGKEKKFVQNVLKVFTIPISGRKNNNAG